ncbi:hypothetical protein DNTS_026989 [Danionella cerebrum]|uniref:Uncharacterized protein n=1 Tax=Danionella cerebrum TaxID=2873325 RepID=A0A553N564_9TELE|nr:hypothetical protein DNTS_026989 [Danionella translucida]
MDLVEEKTLIKVESINKDGEYGICPEISGIKQEDIKEEKDLLQLKKEEENFVKTEENHKMEEYLEEEKTSIKVEFINNDGEYGIYPEHSGVKREYIEGDKDLLQLKDEEEKLHVKTEENHFSISLKMEEYPEEEKAFIKVESLNKDGEYGIWTEFSGIKHEDVKEEKAASVSRETGL